MVSRGNDFRPNFGEKSGLWQARDAEGWVSAPAAGAGDDVNAGAVGIFSAIMRVLEVPANFAGWAGRKRGTQARRR